VIALDTNLLIHAHQREADLHAGARETVRILAESSVPWAICFHSLVEFYGVVTQPRLWKETSSPAQAMKQIRAWRESPSLRILCDSVSGLDRLGQLVLAGQVRGSLVHDARIAACCLNQGVSELWTVDRDFSRFPSLKTRNPLS
jgi:toxin-antitoxin system PIN domain toxin